MQHAMTVTNDSEQQHQVAAVSREDTGSKVESLDKRLHAFQSKLQLSQRGGQRTSQCNGSG